MTPEIEQQLREIDNAYEMAILLTQLNENATEEDYLRILQMRDRMREEVLQGLTANGNHGYRGKDVAPPPGVRVSHAEEQGMAKRSEIPRRHQGDGK